MLAMSVLADMQPFGPKALSLSEALACRQGSVAHHRHHKVLCGCDLTMLWTVLCSGSAVNQAQQRVAQSINRCYTCCAKPSGVRGPGSVDVIAVLPHVMPAIWSC
jgi:hypothetical protein